MRTLLVVLACLAFACAQVPGALFTPTDCNYYCGNISTASICNSSLGTFQNLGYANQAACVYACSAMAAAVNLTLPSPYSYNFAGYNGNTTGNTMACRHYHIQAAISTNASVHCSHASLHGNGYCGSTYQDYCGTYCTLTGAFCPESMGGVFNGATNPGFNGTYCAVMCLAAYGFGNDTSMPVAQSGDSFACRFYHLTAASVLRTTGNGYTHCAHSSPLGGGVCRSGVISTAAASENRIFCTQMAIQCTGANAQWPSTAACLADAANFTETAAVLAEQWGVVNSSSGDTLGCRFYHSGLPVISQGAATHCPHAGWTGGGACGNRPTTAAPTTAAPATTTDSASSVVVSVFVILAALLVAFF